MTAIKILTALVCIVCLTNCHGDHPKTHAPVAQVGVRPFFLVERMQSGPLKTQLQQCVQHQHAFYRTDFVIGHRGAALQFPEHTKESYQAAIRSGAGRVECDVTFTADKALVCRHSQCDLASTTNILAIPKLAAQCTSPFTPADPSRGIKAQARCCTTDITLAQFKTLQGKMDGVNPNARTVQEYMAGTPNWRTDLYASHGTLMTHAESIALFQKAGVKMVPELKAAEVAMPYKGLTQHAYAQKMLAEYQAAGVPPEQVYPQSFNLADIQYWIHHAPEFAQHAIFLDQRYENKDFDPQKSSTWIPSMETLKQQGIEYIAPPLWVLVTLKANNQWVPSAYAQAAKAAGLKIISWSLERSGSLNQGGGWYYQSLSKTVHQEGDVLRLLDVLAKQVSVSAVFSDWPATVTYYANCMGL